MLLTGHLHHSEVERIFSTAATLEQWQFVEHSLAHVQGKLGVIPTAAAGAIANAIASFVADDAQLEKAMESSGVPIAELVRQLRAHVGEPHGDFVHFGATTQDIMDTALVLQLRETVAVTRPILEQTIQGLASLANMHRTDVMAGRTHSQQAVPTTFGLKAANWLAPLLRQRQRLAELLPRLYIVQFGGAAGTLAALGANGLAVQQGLAVELNLGVPIATWHAQRDCLAELASWCSILTGVLAKMAQDVILLAQSEVAEVKESADSMRGGSSTMPQKNNPMVCEAIIAIHRSNVGHLSTLHHALIHEHERATGSWQAEWLALQPMLSLSAAALEKAQWLAENIVVDVERMRRNVADSNGLMLAEAATFALANHVSHTEAKQLVKSACQTVASENCHLIDVLQSTSRLPVDWRALRDEANYVGMADQLIDQILTAVNKEISQ